VNSVPDTADVCFVPAFSGLYSPHWQTDARGYVAMETDWLCKRVIKSRPCNNILGPRLVD